MCGLHHMHAACLVPCRHCLAGEYISVSSQKDAEEADIEKERAEQRKGPAAQQRELEELTNIYVAVSRCSWVVSSRSCWYIYD